MAEGSHSARSCCPQCKVEAEGRGPIEVVFGYRRNSGYVQPQSWCRRCRKGLLPLGENPFRSVLADPPWQYDVKSSGLKGVAEDEYSTMPTAEIARMPVDAITAQDCVLLLWCTNPLLEDGLRVLRSWGFRYKTKMTWVKNTIGVGSWLRGQSEDCLIGVRGNPPKPKVAPSSVLFADNPGHSRKPRQFYPIAERLGIGPRVELFARQRRSGWDAFGNQLSTTIETTLMEALA